MALAFILRSCSSYARRRDHAEVSTDASVNSLDARRFIKGSMCNPKF
jgi:hypothetical protein